MRPDWDDDSPELRVNLARVHDSVEEDAYRRALPTIEAARIWQRRIMRNLEVPDPDYIGTFRGEPGLEDCQVTVGGSWVQPPTKSPRRSAPLNGDCNRRLRTSMH